MGGFWVLPVFLVSVQPLCTGFEVPGRVFGWFSGLTSVFGLGPTIVSPSVSPHVNLSRKVNENLT